MPQKQKEESLGKLLYDKGHKASTKSDDDFVIETVETALKEKSTETLAIMKFNNKKVKKSWTLNASI